MKNRPGIRSMLKVVSLILIIALIGGCETVKDLSFSKRIDYKSSRSTPPLEIPPDLTAPQYDTRYAVASASEMESRNLYAEAHEKSILPQFTNARIERAGSERWLVVETTPPQAWEILRSFWLDTGFVLAVEQPMLGIMETDWAENRAEIPQDLIRRTVGKYLDFFYTTYKRDKFRTRIEEGKTPGTVEIYLSHRGMEQVPTHESGNAPTAFAWALKPPNPELEAEMLMRIMVRFGAAEEQVQTIMTSVDGEEITRARIVKEGDVPRLLVDDDFDHAWRRVGLALDRAGFTVTDRDRSQGIYYVRYADPDIDIAQADQGWLSKLAFWRSNKKTVKPEQYQVNVAAADSAATIVNIIPEGSEAPQSDIEQILAILCEQLK
ncbi:MAG: outer membrane protein assembly factor BamC [Burkholderiales bacterium]|jgi:outer membrane protein assembly factor BamC|nr:outer membrane protein assembly factor BamC [Burkholderiales bacterium]